MCIYHLLQSQAVIYSHSSSSHSLFVYLSPTKQRQKLKGVNFFFFPRVYIELNFFLPLLLFHFLVSVIKEGNARWKKSEKLSVFIKKGKKKRKKGKKSLSIHAWRWLKIISSFFLLFHFEQSVLRAERVLCKLKMLLKRRETFYLISSIIC